MFARLSLCASLSLALAVAAASQSQADAPLGLTIVVVDVGQGDGVVVQAPDGQVHVFDAGPSGQGLVAMMPVINSLQPTSYGYAVLSHFHTDHLGGLDEVLFNYPFQVALDRGDVNRPSNSSVNDYLSSAAGIRQTAVVGAVYQLGGGATMTCICANGSVVGGGFVNPRGAQEENARSVAMRIDYGDFSMWIAGDLTGGGNSTANVEGLASAACGDVDVYKLNHNGSNTSTNPALVLNLDPELAVVCCGDGNSFGHPTANTINRLNQPLASRAIMSTTEGSADTQGFLVAGNIRIDTDGYRYRATGENGDFLDFYCDEVEPDPLSFGDVLVSEVHRDPDVVADFNGEYIELINVGPVPVALEGLTISDNGGTVTIASNYMLVPGRPMLFQRDGSPVRNGGQPMGAVLPVSSLQLANGIDDVTVRQGATTLDALNYNGLLPGGTGVAAERRDLRAPHLSGLTFNYAPAPQPYGLGDFGSPGVINPSDTTDHPVQIGISYRLGTATTLHATAVDDGFKISVIGIAASAGPGFPFGGTTIPLNFDQLFQDALGAPGVLTLMPAGGYRSLDIPVPSPNPFFGVVFWTSHIVLDFTTGLAEASPAVPFTLL